MKDKLALFILVLLLTPFLAFASGGQEEAADDAPGVTAEVPSEFNEAPVLAAMVEAGELPPVDERLPDTPMVVEPNDSIGQYGGQIVRGNGPNGEANLLLTREATGTIPNYLESFEFNDDGTVFTMNIRRGLKWSDGEPVTADDYLFQYYDIDLNEELNPVAPNWAKVGDELVEMVKVDDYTVQLQFARPFYAVIHKMNLVGNRFFFGPAPSHWLGRFHIDYNDDADAVAQEADFEEWWQYFSQVADLEDADDNFTGEKLGRPGLGPWVFKEETPTAYIYERNPYYYKVDTAGNQLPYIDTHIHVKIEDAEVRLLKILNGELDFVAWGTSIENFPVMKQNEAAGGYETWVAPDLWGAAPGLSINQTYNGDNAEVIAPLLQDLRFRQALSLAIDRDEINELAALGQGTPRQATVHPKTIGYEERWAEAYAEFNPERANALLDSMGLTERGSNGMRLDPEGRQFTLNIPVNPAASWNQTTELVEGYWEDIGVDVNIRSVSGSAFGPIRSNGTYAVFAWPLDRVFGPAFIESNGSWLNPNFWFGPIGPDWKTWLASDGDEGIEPPQVIKDLYQALLDIQYVPPEEQAAAVKVVGDAYAENLWMIGTVGMMGKPIAASTELGNVRKDSYPDNISTGGTRNNWMEQYYWTSATKRGE